MTQTASNVQTTDNAGTLTSLAQIFEQPINGMQVNAIEIPLFQRDYAQGRSSEQARHVRERFIADLCNALDGDTELHLDFVFGDVVDMTLYPLDGQQRLTTLFLLHCYLAWHHFPDTSINQPWHSFRYATRPGARAFCQFLTQCHPDMAKPKLSDWLRDQPGYLPTWKHDPTIQGMLVVLDLLHQRYAEKSQDQRAFAWARLIDPEHPAIRFLVLPVAAQKLDNTLYVKMNSRGRPLSAFENFKADFEALLHKRLGKDDAEVKSFSHKIDTQWADLFWQYRGGNDLIDEECMRYLRFLFEVLAWKRELPVQTSQGDLKALNTLSESLLGSHAPEAKARADFQWVTQALDLWLSVQSGDTTGPAAIASLFAELFTRDPHTASTPLRIFNFRDFGDAPVGVDLFHACCALYGTRPWSLAHTVLLYGVMQGLMNGTSPADLHPRLRLLRNLIEASRSEIRSDDTRNNMPALLREVEIIMAGGSLTDVKTFNQVQVRNELTKRALASAHPALQSAIDRLEDHELLRGGLTVFDLDPTQAHDTFAQRATAFGALFKNPYQLVSAALLAKGNEGRVHGHVHGRGSGHRLTYLGAPRQRQAGLWEDHWRIRYNEPVHPSASALMALLDDMTTGQSPQQIIGAFTSDPDTAKDWRYYIAKYEVMRGEHLEFAGSYVVSPDPGMAICMPKSDSCDNRSNHHDAYLLALAEAAGLSSLNIRNQGWPRCFPGHETNERHLELARSGLRIRCVANGWAFSNLPEDPLLRDAYDSVASRHNVKDALCEIPQNNGTDMADRIHIGAVILRDLVKAGL
ncbi:DUF262 domain-containing protein [Diaphorobacter caeni]|uniref:DUF262 domain-containing protein n=1 Tax=Diaphorobacter caeni TaxID=2784387 RepID=UPI00188E73E7|nr:DUF262 domain-containing protein [Diaphorobacter caeni]MBF5007279.1 DUF262 domain-containing protein [Diaphorobacter caeni]